MVEGERSAMRGEGGAEAASALVRGMGEGGVEAAARLSSASNLGRAQELQLGSMMRALKASSGATHAAATVMSGARPSPRSTMAARLRSVAQAVPTARVPIRPAAVSGGAL